MNEKNFVGLAVKDDYIACGSETNEVFVYHKVRKQTKPHPQCSWHCCQSCSLVTDSVLMITCRASRNLWLGIDLAHRI
jgi:hypothetical protein